jgi:hypothetical protein
VFEEQRTGDVLKVREHDFFLVGVRVGLFFV